MLTKMKLVQQELIITVILRYLDSLFPPLYGILSLNLETSEMLSQ